MLKVVQWVLLMLTIGSLIAAMSIASVAVALHLVSKTPRQRNYLVVGFLGSVPIDPSREAVPLATPPSDAIGG